MSNYTQKKVFVGLSGGVDSAVSAALLKKQGYDVTGVFIKAWAPSSDPFVPRSFSEVGCAWKEDRRSAMRAAAVLGIPFVTLDLEKEYKKQVVDYMIDEYKAGRTPNPDVMCNKEIKFGEFLKFALDSGADFVATGHYAEKVLRGKYYVLRESIDKNKDQSYFLWTLTQDQLKRVLFPVGDLKKEEVRKLAEKFGLPQAERKDSQGVCFLGQVDMKGFLKEYIGVEKGKVLDINGEVIGEHDGALLYTLGERHGFRVWNKDTETKPLYVVDKNVKENTITVASKNAFRKVLGSPRSHPIQTGLRSARLSSEDFSRRLININWINEEPKGQVECRYRYRQEKIECEVEDDKVIFNELHSDIAGGQSVVFYEGEKVLGGAIIS